ASSTALAGLLYAVDDAHGLPVGWLANRNALFAGAFGLAAVVVHDRAIRKSAIGARVFAPLLLALAFLSGEVAFGALGYLVAYALAFDPAPLPRRLLSLVPYGGVVAGWALCVRALHFGVAGSAFYTDPIQAPLRFLATFPGRWLSMCVSQFAVPSSDLW